MKKLLHRIGIKRKKERTVPDAEKEISDKAQNLAAELCTFTAKVLK